MILKFFIKKINNMKYFLFSLFTIILILTIFFTSLNFFLGGPPLYNVFKISIKDAVFISKKSKFKKDHEITSNNYDYIDKCGKTENGFYNLAYKQDNYGFRDNNISLFSDTDIVILGDSFGISSCINSPNDLTTKLKKNLKNDKVLNISVSGTGPYYQKELLKNLFKKKNTKFKTFIWLFYEGNDHEDFNKNYGKKIEFSFNPISSNNTDEIEVKYRPTENLFFLRIKLFFANYLRGFGTLVKYFKSYPDLIKYKNNYDETVKDLSYFLNKNNIDKKIIFYIPKYTRLSYKNINHPNLKQLNNLKKLVEVTSKKYDFTFVDGSNIYYSEKDPLKVFHYGLPTHFNIKGYDILVSELTKVLLKN